MLNCAGGYSLCTCTAIQCTQIYAHGKAAFPTLPYMKGGIGSLRQ